MILICVAALRLHHFRIISSLKSTVVYTVAQVFLPYCGNVVEIKDEEQILVCSIASLRSLFYGCWINASLGEKFLSRKCDVLKMSQINVFSWIIQFQCLFLKVEEFSVSHCTLTWFNVFLDFQLCFSRGQVHFYNGLLCIQMQLFNWNWNLYIWYQKLLKSNFD